MNNPCDISAKNISYCLLFVFQIRAAALYFFQYLLIIFFFFLILMTAAGNVSKTLI